jgi:hypothetical protein
MKILENSEVREDRQCQEGEHYIGEERDGSSFLNPRSSRAAQEVAAIRDLAKRETSLIQRLRWILIVVLMCFALVVAASTFLVLSKEQENDYNDSVSVVELEIKPYGSFVIKARSPAVSPPYVWNAVQSLCRYNRNGN